MGQRPTAEDQKSQMPPQSGEADPPPTSLPVREAGAIKRHHSEQKQELFDYMQAHSNARRSPKSPKNSAVGLAHDDDELSHTVGPRLPCLAIELMKRHTFGLQRADSADHCMWAHSLSPNSCSPKPVVEAFAPQEGQTPQEPSNTGMPADRSAELSSLSRSFHLICAELVEALQNLGEGSIRPKQLQLMVKHLEECYRDTPVEAVSMSDKTIVALTGKSNDHIADYIELAYEEDWVRVFHQFLGLGALWTGFTKLEPGVFEVIWPGGIRLRQSPNPMDVRNKIAEFGQRYQITRFEYCVDGREYGYLEEAVSWLPSRFSAGEPLIRRVQDLPEHTNFLSEQAVKGVGLKNEKEVVYAERIKTAEPLTGQQETQISKLAAEDLRVTNAQQEAAEKAETPDAQHHSKAQSHTQTVNRITHGMTCILLKRTRATAAGA